MLAIVFSPSFTTFSGVLAFGIEDNTKTFSLSFLASASTSACVNSASALLSISFAFSKSIFIVSSVEVAALSLLIFSNSSSTFSILVCNVFLSNTFFSTCLLASVLLFNVELASVSSSVKLVTFSIAIFSVFPPDTSAALATPAAPKKILAPITTEAAPTLNFLIE